MTVTVHEPVTAPGRSEERRGAAPGEGTERPGFFRRYRLPLLLAVVALCGYAGSIVYIVYVRGQIG